VNDHSFPAAEGTTNPVAALLRGSAVPALLALLVLSLLAVPFGLDEVKSALVGGAIAVLAMAVGPLLHQLCRNLDPNLTVGVAVLAYCTVVGLFGLGFSLLNDTSWLVGGFAALGVILVSVSWAVGHMRTALKLRQPLYQHDDRTAER
jgi:ATP synthase protein I